VSAELDERRKQLVLEFTDFARAVARKLAKDLPIDPEDAVAAGFEGLVQAAHRISFDRWDSERGPLETNFRSLAYLRIRGAVYDEARRSSFTKRRGLEKGLRFEMLSLDKQRMDADGEAMPLLELECYDEAQPEFMDYLDDNERAVIVGKLAGYTNDEIAQSLGISPARIPQLRRSAREKVTEFLGGHPILDADG
jgi:RNA polymerase sigma factor (sigma-70 family)